MLPPWAPALPCRAPPTVPGMPTSVSRPASPRWTAVVTTRPSRAPPPAATERPSIANIAERRRGKVDHQPGHAFVAHQDVRALAQQPHVDALLVASPHQRRSVHRSCPARRSIPPGRPTETKCASPAVRSAARSSQNRSLDPWDLNRGETKSNDDTEKADLVDDRDTFSRPAAGRNFQVASP